MRKTVLITGASRGIGKAAAIKFAAAGYAVAVHYHRSVSSARALQAQLRALGTESALFCAEISDRAEIERMFSQIQAQLGNVDVLVNNAGIAQQKLFTDLSPAEWEEMFAVHVTGAFHCTQCALRTMIPKKEGAILNVASIWGQTGASCEVHYSAAKGALIGMTKSLAKELAPCHIRVNCVAPGLIATDMNASLSCEDQALLQQEIPMSRMGTPEEIADAIFFLASPAASYITGQVLGVNGGWYA